MLFDGDGALPVAYVITTVPDTISRKNKDSLLAVLTSWGGKGGWLDWEHSHAALGVS